MLSGLEKLVYPGREAVTPVIELIPLEKGEVPLLSSGEFILESEPEVERFPNFRSTGITFENLPVEKRIPRLFLSCRSAVLISVSGPVSLTPRVS